LPSAVISIKLTDKLTTEIINELIKIKLIKLIKTKQMLTNASRSGLDVTCLTAVRDRIAQ